MIQFVYTSSKNRCKSTDFGVPPAEPNHGLNLCDHNCGHLMQWKCDVPTIVGTIVYIAVTYLPLEIHARVYTQVPSATTVPQKRGIESPVSVFFLFNTKPGTVLNTFITVFYVYTM